MNTITDTVNSDGTVTRVITTKQVITFTPAQYKALADKLSVQATDIQAKVQTTEANVALSQANAAKTDPVITPPNNS